MVTPTINAVSMTEFQFRKGCYLAMREGFNAEKSPGFIDKKWDKLIRDTISLIENGEEEMPYAMSQIEVVGLAQAANRRKLPLPKP